MQFRKDVIITTNTSSYYCPPDLYESTREVKSNDSQGVLEFSYSFPVQRDVPHFLRLHFVDFEASTALQRHISITINNETVLPELDVAGEVGGSTAMARDFLFVSKGDGNVTLTLSANRTLPFPSPSLAALELLLLLNASSDSQLTPVAASLAAFPSPSATLLSLEGGQEVRPTPPSGGANRAVGLVVGSAMGAAAAAVFFVLFLGLLYLETARRGMRVVVGDGRNGKKWSAGDLQSYDASCRSGAGSSLLSSSHRGTRVFSLEQLEAATQGFDPCNVIGRGGFGKVYRADFGGGFMAAVKKLDVGSQQGEKEFLTEVELLSRLHHRHLVNLIGYCQVSEQCLLVYEIVGNGTLREHITDPAKRCRMRWPMRAKLALGAARGLEYLHRGASPPVIHRDIKSTNILIDSQMQAKVADFGLSKLLGEKQNMSQIVTGVKGTLGYLDPQYYRSHQLTDKSDVYSFGVVLLEVLTGRHAIWKEESSRQEKEEEGTKKEASYRPPTNPFLESANQAGEDNEDEYVSNLVEWALPSLEAKTFYQIAAPEVLQDVKECEASIDIFAKVAASCVMVQAKDRPNMSDVVRELENCVDCLPLDFKGLLPLAESDPGVQGFSKPQKKPVPRILELFSQKS